MSRNRANKKGLLGKCESTKPNDFQQGTLQMKGNEYRKLYL
jgi:hypothetical protein